MWSSCISKIRGRTDEEYKRGKWEKSRRTAYRYDSDINHGKVKCKNIRPFCLSMPESTQTLVLISDDKGFI